MILSIITAKFNIGAREEIRTPDPLVRSQVLYPAELRARHRYYIPNLVVLTSCLRQEVLI